MGFIYVKIFFRTKLDSHCSPHTKCLMSYALDNEQWCDITPYINIKKQIILISVHLKPLQQIMYRFRKPRCIFFIIESPVCPSQCPTILRIFRHNRNVFFSKKNFSVFAQEMKKFSISFFLRFSRSTMARYGGYSNVKLADNLRL